jgi:hypothetical protein
MTEFRISDFEFRICHTAFREATRGSELTVEIRNSELGALTRVSYESAVRLEQKSEIRNPKFEMCVGRN